MSVEITFATQHDVPEIMRLIKELAAFENAANEVMVTEEVLLKDGFGSTKHFECLIAKSANGEVMGTAIFFTGYSTWKGQTLYLEDLIVDGRYRRQGIGSMLFDELLNIAKEKNVKRMDWQVLDWNSSAIDFYKKHDAQLDPTWINGKIYF